ncbi:MAG: SRPBCC family protein [Jatrophihabitans sp.]
MSEFEHRGSVVIAAPPRAVYDLVSDVTRTGEWSPICRSCAWNEDGGPRVGATFTGHNEDSGRTWDTTCTVEAAEPGRTFSWVVGEGWVRWGYDLTAVDEGTELTEWWEFTEAGRTMFAENFGDRAQAQIDNRVERAHSGIAATLESIKSIAQASGETSG